MPIQTRSRLVSLSAILVALFLTLLSCELSPARAADPSWREPLDKYPRGTNEVRTMPLWPARSYTVHLPPSYDGTSPYPVVINFHGRGGNRKTVRLETCPGQDPTSRGCLDRVADCVLEFFKAHPMW